MASFMSRDAFGAAATLMRASVAGQAGAAAAAYWIGLYASK